MKNKAIRIIVSILLLIVALLFSALLYWVGKDVCFEKQYKLFEQIRNISSIIFGVCGAWLAITYPKAVASIKLNPTLSKESDIENTAQDVNILLGFVTSMMISIVIIAICLSLPFAKEIIVKCPWLLNHKNKLLSALFCLLGWVTLLQLFILGSTLKNTYLALMELKKVAAEAITKQELDKNKEY